MPSTTTNKDKKSGAKGSKSKKGKQDAAGSLTIGKPLDYTLPIAPGTSTGSLPAGSLTDDGEIIDQPAHEGNSPETDQPAPAPERGDIQQGLVFDGTNWVPLRQPPLEHRQPAPANEEQIIDRLNRASPGLKIRGIGTIIVIVLALIIVLGMICNRGKRTSAKVDKSIQETQVLKDSSKAKDRAVDSLTAILADERQFRASVQAAVDAAKESAQATREREQVDRDGEATRKQSKIDSDETIRKIKNAGSNADLIRILDEQLKLQSSIRNDLPSEVR